MRVENIFLIVLQRLEGGVHHHPARSRHHRVGGGGIPLAGGRQARVNVRAAFRHQAQLQRRPHGGALHLAHFVTDKGFQLFHRLATMATAGDHYHRRGAGTALNRLALTVVLFKGTHTLAAQVGHCRYRHMHHAQHRGLAFHQRDVDGELTIALDKFLGAIQRVHQPEARPVLAIRIGNAAGFFGKHRDIRGQRLQAGLNDLVRRHIRLGNGRLVILGFYPQIITLIDSQNGVPRFTGNLGKRFQQGIKIGHRFFHFSMLNSGRSSKLKVQKREDSPSLMAG